MGDTGVADEKFKILNLRLGECKTIKVKKKADSGRRGGGALAFFQSAKKAVREAQLADEEF